MVSSVPPACVLKGGKWYGNFCYIYSDVAKSWFDAKVSHCEVFLIRPFQTVTDSFITSLVRGAFFSVKYTMVGVTFFFSSTLALSHNPL